MSNFYNKYKRLFTEKEEKEQLSLRNNRSQFINLYNDLNTPKLAINHNLSNTYEDRNNKKIQKLGRSPALDEFERHILPRLKTEPESSNIFRQANISHPLSQVKERLPRLIPLQKQEERRPQPNYVGLSPVTNKQQEEDLINYYKRGKSKEQQWIQLQKKNQQALVQSLPAQPAIKVSPQIFNSQKERNIRMMSINQSPISLQKPNKNNLRKSRQQYIYESQLYGINQNPYAFANSKLNDIKKIQKSYPRGMVNQYQKCLLNRLYKKKQMKERRERLKKFLERDMEQYNSKHYPN